MKKILLATLLATSFNAIAEENSFVHGQYTFRDTISSDSANPNRQGVNLIIGHKVAPNITVDLGSQFRTEKLNSENGSSSNRLEAGASYGYAINQDVALYVRGALGEKFSALDNFSYYSVEPGVKAQLTSNIVGKVGYRYRDSFGDSKADKTNTFRVGVEYALNKTNAITTSVDRSYGDSEFVGYNVGYLVKF
jgi:hypothetical protein